MSKRKGLSKKLRFDVFKRDSFECQYCGATPPKVILHCDHVIPVKNGGENDIDNLVTSCESCNLGKGATSLNVIPEKIQIKAKKAAEKEAQIVAYNRLLESKRDRLEGEAWDVASIFIDHFDKNCGIRKDWFRSIKSFVGKLPAVDVMDAMEIAIDNWPDVEDNCFRYFCGICWNKIKGDDRG